MSVYDGNNLNQAISTKLGKKDKAGATRNNYVNASPNLMRASHGLFKHDSVHGNKNKQLNQTHYSEKVGNDKKKTSVTAMKPACMLMSSKHNKGLTTTES